jgi:hypothetical protein
VDSVHYITHKPPFIYNSLTTTIFLLKLKLCTPLRHVKKVKLQLYAFVTSALVGRELFTSPHFPAALLFPATHILVMITMSYPVPATKFCFSLRGRREFDGSRVSLRLGSHKDVNRTNDSSSFCGLIIDITTGACLLTL